MQQLPEEFIRRQSESMPAEDFRNFLESLESPAPVSIRLNPLKPSAKEGERVSWCAEGIYLDQRPVFTLDPLLHSGAYYVQEASSMFTGWLASRILSEYDQVRILDLCAAPGGKTTHLAAVAGPDAVVVANEVIRSRAGILAENVKKWGSGNIAVTSNDPADLGRLTDFFDMIIVDAPCSGEGMFRKDPAARGQWSPENVNLCAARQRRILSDIWDALRPGGTMIYSTCTFNRGENEENALWVAEELGGEIIEFDQVPEGVVKSDAGYRFYPHLIRGEGFYAVAIRKHGDSARRDAVCLQRGSRAMAMIKGNDGKELERWVGHPLDFVLGGQTIYGFSPAMRNVVDTLRANLNLVYSGVAMGELIRGELKPEHTLALYYDLDHGVVPPIELDLDNVLEYLRRNTVDPALFPEGLSLVTFSGTPLGWIKRIGRRCNNLYPSGWRIMNF